VGHGELSACRWIGVNLTRGSAMKETSMSARLPVTLLFVLASIGLLAAQGALRQSPRDLFERARLIEESNQNLTQAIALYTQAASEAATSNQRDLAATAQLRVGLLHERLGQKAEAERAFKMVVTQYSDQPGTASLARARLGSASAKPAGGMSHRRLWTLPGTSTYAGTVSHDGRHLPFANWGVQRGSGHLFLHDVVSGADRRLTEDAAEIGFVEHAVFAPDDARLAFNWFNGRHFELSIIDVKAAAAARPRVVFSNPEVPQISPHDWSGDGKWLAVQLQRKDKTSQVGLVAVQDGSLRVLKSVDWRGSTQLFFSPDSRYLAYDLPTGAADARDVFVLALDGSHEAPAVVHQANDVLVGWTPDGTRLLFSSDRTGSPALWSVPVSNGRPGGAVEQVMVADAGTSLGLTRPGALYSLVTHSYFTKMISSDIHVGTFDFAAGRFLSGPELAVRTFVGSNNFPAWSPDGEHLAYLRPNGIIMMARAGDMKPVRELKPALTFYIGGASMRWSPDGRSIAMNATDLKGRRGIFRIDAVTGEATRIPLGAGGGINPMWTPDGKRIVFTRLTTQADPGVAAVIERDLASGTEREIFRKTAPAPWNPGWTFVDLSPDGRSVAAVVNEAWPGGNIGKWSLLVASVAGGEPRELMRGEARGADVLMWAPDGRSVFVTAIRAGAEGDRQRDVWRVPIDGSAPQKLDLDLASLGRPFNSDQRMHVHPDGRRVAFAAAEPAKADEVWVLENFLPPPGSKNVPIAGKAGRPPRRLP
jgi:Tol biopolymer transport system component